MHVIRKEFPRLDSHIVERLGSFSTPNLSDAMGRSGAMCSDIKAVFNGVRLAGPAYTVKNHTRDNLMSHYALK